MLCKVWDSRPSRKPEFCSQVIMDDEVTQVVENVIKGWEETSSSVENNVKAIGAFGTSVDGMKKEENSHQRLNGLAQDGLSQLRSLQFRLDLLAQQLLTEEQVHLHLGLRNANLQAQTNMRKAAQKKRELLLGGGEESTIRRHNLQLILLVGFFLFSCAVLYVMSKRIGLLKLQRKITEAIKAGMIVPGDLGAVVAENGFNGVRIDDNGVPNVEVPLLEMHGEL
ncbi:hypothetical protein MKX01_014766 [Papaver californicum]|nr:hypothetical protein MKX01_014766 [Papaver californicum]